MQNSGKNFDDKIRLLKEARLQLLRLHKNLIDVERQNYENKNGRVSHGQFLQILLNDENFSWLRTFSVLIVEIDEMFDLDDGYTDEMLEKQFLQLQNLMNFKASDKDFNFRFEKSIQKDSSVGSKYIELKNLLAKK